MSVTSTLFGSILSIIFINLSFFVPFIILKNLVDIFGGGKQNGKRLKMAEMKDERASRKHYLIGIVKKEKIKIQIPVIHQNKLRKIKALAYLMIGMSLDDC